MAVGHIDYTLEPWSTPDEIFHRLISELLQEWRRQHAPGRREITVIADPLTPEGSRFETISDKTASHTPSTRASPTAAPGSCATAGTKERPYRWCS